MQDLTVTLEKIAKMQDRIGLSDWIVGSVADNLSVTLRTNCPFGFGLRHFAADQNQNDKIVVLIGGGQSVRHQQGEVAAHFATTSQEDQDCKMRT